MRASVHFFWRILRAALLSLSVLMLIVTLTPVVGWITLHLEEPWYDGNGEVLVVLGGGMLTSSTPGQDTYIRCIYASWILKQQHFTHVVVTGGAGAAESMARLLEQNGVDEHVILLENRAYSTFENAVFTKQLLERTYMGRLPAIVILTSDYHSWRAHRVFVRAGFETHTIPVPDAIKQSAVPLQRWPAFENLLSEFGKTGYYLAHGRM